MESGYVLAGQVVYHLEEFMYMQKLTQDLTFSIQLEIPRLKATTLENKQTNKQTNKHKIWCIFEQGLHIIYVHRKFRSIGNLMFCLQVSCT